MDISNSMLADVSVSSTNYEQMASIFKTVSIVFFALAAVCLALGIITFIVFKIPNVIGDLSGRNARKSIEQMRETNEKGGKKSHRPHPVASDRGTLTEPIKQNSSKLRKQKQVIPKPQTVSHVDTKGSSATDVLDDPNATQKLDFNETGTEILAEGTQVLSNEQMQAALNQTAVGFKMIQDIVLIHTDEVI